MASTTPTTATNVSTAKAILNAASQLAWDSGSLVAGTEHILIAMLQREPPPQTVEKFLLPFTRRSSGLLRTPRAFSTSGLQNNKQPEPGSVPVLENICTSQDV